MSQMSFMTEDLPTSLKADYMGQAASLDLSSGIPEISMEDKAMKLVFCYNMKETDNSRGVSDSPREKVEARLGDLQRAGVTAAKYLKPTTQVNSEVKCK